MNPSQIKSDLEFLESHVRSVCGGQLPPLVGPYAIPRLLLQMEGMERRFIDGYIGKKDDNGN